MSKRRYPQTDEQPYSDMRARSGVLIAGFACSLVAFALVLMSSLFLFLPDLNFAKDVSPTILIKWLLIAGVSLAFISTVFAVAGANTKKSVARLTMAISTTSFIVGSAILVIVLLFRTILPLDAIARLSESLSMM